MREDIVDARLRQALDENERLDVFDIASAKYSGRLFFVPAGRPSEQSS
jgi:hypothetical protein